MTVKQMVGLEAEYLLFNGKGDVIVPPRHFDRDDFPLLGEIRGEPGKDVNEVVLNFMKARMELEDGIRKTHSIRFMNQHRVPLKIYREANRQIEGNKETSLADIRNIHGIDISEFSDQVIHKNKIQGIRVSCGLHIHFSCEEVDEKTVERQEYEPLRIPLEWGFGRIAADSEAASLDEMVRPDILVFRKMGYTKEKTLRARASRLNKPAIHYIVNAMDARFFDRFAPSEKERTKYRQPGFFELKPYGFEYRSLPANDDSLAALPEIVSAAFDLLKEVNEY